MIDYAKLVKALRNKLLLTQSEFAKTIGVTFATVNRWENDAHEPTMVAKRKIHSLCKKHGINPDDYVRQAKEETSNS